MIAFLQLPDVAFRDRKPHVQTAGIERFGEVIICAGGERLLKVLGVGACSHEKDIHLVAVWTRSQAFAKLDPALARQHPVEDEKGKTRLRDLGLRLLRTGTGDNFMSTRLDQTAQIAPAIGVVLD